MEYGSRCLLISFYPASALTTAFSVMSEWRSTAKSYWFCQWRWWVSIVSSVWRFIVKDLFMHLVNTSQCQMDVTHLHLIHLQFSSEPVAPWVLPLSSSAVPLYIRSINFPLLFFTPSSPPVSSVTTCLWHDYPFKMMMSQWGWFSKRLVTDLFNLLCYAHYVK